MAETKKWRILNVDDDEAGRYAITKILKNAGFDVIEAANGTDALTMAAAQHPDLVLLDVNLPDIGGFEVCKRLKLNPDTASILVVHQSAVYVSPKDRVEGLTGGADGYLVHPLDPGEIVETIRAFLRIKTAEMALRETTDYLQNLIDFASAPIIVWDPDFRITRFNHAFEHLTGRIEQEVIGQPLDILFPKESIDASLALTKKTLSGERWESVEIPIFASDGVIHTILWNSTNILTAEAELISTIAQGVDITERKRAEEQIKSALAEKEVLLREIHHRVKNNLAGIISLIDLQIGSVSDPVTITLLKDLETRIRSMVLVHESLYRTEDLTRISLTNYTEELTRYLFQVYGTATDIQCRIDMGDVTMSIGTAIPCGLVMSEIVTNSLKYAFPRTFSCKEIRGEPCTIALSLHREGSDYLLKIADNGTGIPEGSDVTMSKSLGLFLIRFIVEHQLSGSLLICTTGGTAYTIRFPEPEVKERHSDE